MSDTTIYQMTKKKAGLVVATQPAAGDDVPLLGSTNGIGGNDDFSDIPPEHSGSGFLANCLLAASCPLSVGMDSIFVNMFGRELRIVSTQIQSIDLPDSATAQRRTVLDQRGNPLVVSAVVVYQIINSYRASVNVANAREFVLTQGETTLKQVISRHPYESPDGQESCLKTEGDLVTGELRRELQEKVKPAGVLIHSFTLKEISYAPVIAAAMLKRQQAAAMVEARGIIVKGAVDIASSAVDALRVKGIELDQPDTTRLVTNLLTVICSESEAVPTLPM